MAPTAHHWTWRWIRCPVCSADAGRFTGYRGGFAHRRRAGFASAIMRCSGCGLVYPNPMPFPADHSHYEKVEAYFGSDDHDVKIRDARRLLASLTRQRGSPGRLIDIGCGCGESLVAARAEGWEATGVEPSEDFVRIGRQKLGAAIDQGWVEDMGYPAGAYDLVILAGVLEHVYAPMELLSEAHRLLADGGMIYVDVPNESSVVLKAAHAWHLLHGRQWSVNLSPTFPPFHVLGFSPRTLRFALVTAGFDAIQTHSYPLSYSSVRSRSLRAVLHWMEHATAPAGGSSGILALGRRARTPT